jgi:hypothetical protein
MELDALLNRFRIASREGKWAYRRALRRPVNSAANRRERKMRLRACLLITGLLAGLTGPAQARLFRTWTYQELKDGSDLVVIAHPLESRHLEEKYALPGISRMPAERSDSRHLARGIETKFEIFTTLKGIELQSVVLHHYRNADEGAENNGPSFMEFDPKACDKYLLFLKNRKDGQYEGIAGQTDLILSIKKLGCM